MPIFNDAVVIHYSDNTKSLQSPHIRPEITGPIEEYIVREGDSLFSIATQKYGDTAMWYKLAEVNLLSIDNPFELEIGTLLFLPR